MKRLYLLRHAKAESLGTENDGDDFSRPLSKSGVEDAKDMGKYLKQNNYIPSIAIASPAHRTKQTLETVSESADFDCKFRFPQRLYLASPGHILAEISKMEDDFNSLLVVGHNNGLQELAVLLCENADSKYANSMVRKFPTCTFVAFNFPITTWRMVEPYSGDVIDYMSPDLFGE